MSDSNLPATPPSWFTRTPSDVKAIIGDGIEQGAYNSGAYEPDSSSYTGDIPAIPETKGKGKKTKGKKPKGDGKDQCPSVKPSRGNPKKTMKAEKLRRECRVRKERGRG